MRMKRRLLKLGRFRKRRLGREGGLFILQKNAGGVLAISPR